MVRHILHHKLIVRADFVKKFVLKKISNRNPIATLDKCAAIEICSTVPSSFSEFRHRSMKSRNDLEQDT